MIVTLILFSAIIVGFVMTSPSLSYQSGLSDVPQGAAPPSRIQYAAHAPIYISGDSGFLGANSSTGISWGSGTYSDPYIISDWDITADTGHGIWIEYTTAYFMIRNCYVHDGAPLDYNGIMLVECKNGLIVNNELTGNSRGVFIGTCSNLNITDNEIVSNANEGLYAYELRNSSLYYNNCTLNSYEGMEFFFSENNSFIGNNNTHNYIGIALYDSTRNIFIDNSCLNNSNGILIDSSNENMVLSGTFSGNDYGICLTGSSRNIVSENNCSSNNIYGVWVAYSSHNNSIRANDCSLSSQGIYVLSSRNNNISDNLCYQNAINGIRLVDSENNTIGNNSLLESYYGIYSLSSHNNFISKNNCSYNEYGIELSRSNDSVLYNNELFSNNQFGIYILESNKNTIFGNICQLNLVGVDLYSSTDNLLIYNYLVDSISYGIRIRDAASSSNELWRNGFFGNNGATGTYDPSHLQASDEGTANWWNTSDGYGNYWTDWTTPDNNLDGRVDIPYNLSGISKAKDYYPLTMVPVIPEIPEPSPLITSAIIIVLFLVFGGIRNRRKR